MLKCRESNSSRSPSYEQYCTFYQKKRLLPLEHNVKAASLTHDTLMLDVVSYLNTAYPEDLRLEDISEQFYVSKNTLCARFCSAMSCSPMQYLAFVRLSHVKKLLSTTSKKIDEIAALCGYSSPNYIILIFKKTSAFHQTNTEKQSKVYIIALITLYNRKADMRYAYPLFSFYHHYTKKRDQETPAIFGEPRGARSKPWGLRAKHLISRFSRIRALGARSRIGLTSLRVAHAPAVPVRVRFENQSAERRGSVSCQHITAGVPRKTSAATDFKCRKAPEQREERNAKFS